MQAIIVMPCLNEAERLAATCHSLGFGKNAHSNPRATLILIDNASTDATATIARQIRDSSPAGRVHTLYEKEPGYVPPRRLGIVHARQLAHAQGWSESDVLILQADADTIYGAGYIDAMLAAATAQTRPFMLEGVSETTDNGAAYQGYLDVCCEADEAVADLFVDYADDIIVDGKVAGYRLNDYFAWGGTAQEYTRYGELHASESRLCIRAQLAGVTRLRVEDTTVQHSIRKAETDPVMQLAMAEFTRETGWRDWWHRHYQGASRLSDFADPAYRSTLHEAKFMRQAHSLILFALVPHAVARLSQKALAVPDCLQPLLRIYDDLTTHDVLASTSILFDRAFYLVEAQPDLFRAAIDKAATQSR